MTIGPTNSIRSKERIITNIHEYPKCSVPLFLSSVPSYRYSVRIARGAMLSRKTRYAWSKNVGPCSRYTKCPVNTNAAANWKVKVCGHTACAEICKCLNCFVYLADFCISVTVLAKLCPNFEYKGENENHESCWHRLCSRNAGMLTPMPTTGYQLRRLYEAEHRGKV